MKVVQIALKEVADQKTLEQQGDLSLPLLGLAEAYNKLMGARSDFFELSEASTGRELKIAVAALRLRDKISLLYLYKDSVKAIARANTQPAPQDAEVGQVHTESSVRERLEALEQEEQIRFRALVKRVALFTIAPVPPFLAGTWFVLGWQKGTLDGNAIATGLMSTVLEIFKLIFID